MNIFIDESIHDRADFIVVAAVWGDASIQSSVEAALRECGFDPAKDEFKSSMTMAGNPSARLLRDHLQSILGRCKIAVAVCPVSERSKIAGFAGKLIESIDPKNLEVPAIAYFDEGMKRAELSLPAGITAVHGCDSRKVAGIQVADCAAHLVSVMLLAELGFVTKTVPASTVYPDDEGEIELAWTLWASVRYALSGGKPIGGYDEEGWCEPMMHPFGLVVSEGCSPAVKAAVDKQLSSVWVGCIH